MDGIRHDRNRVRNSASDNLQGNEYGGYEDDYSQLAVVLGRILGSRRLIELMDISLLALFHLN